jgi:hypothetical protein
LDTKVSGELFKEVASLPIHAGDGFGWYLGALDPAQLRVVVAHYHHRYPALDWGWLVQALAELRLLGEPRRAVVRFLEQHQLRSAETLVERFLLDVGLWVVAGEALTLA